MTSTPIREKIKEIIIELGGKATKQKIIDRINELYSDTNEDSVSAHLYSLSVNYPARINHNRNRKPRPLNPDYDFLYRINTNDFEIYDPGKHGNYQLIESEGKTVVAKDGTPVSNEDESSLLTYIQNKMQMNANYQPIVLKTLLEKGPDAHFTASLEEIKEQIKILNFDRTFNMGDAIKAFTGALKEYVTFENDGASLQMELISEKEIQECLKICGQKIAEWHVNKIAEKEYDMWHILPGSSNENFPYLNEFLKTNSIGIGWDKIRDISNLSEQELKEKFIEKYENDNAFQGFLDFTKIKQKDIIVLTKGQQEITDFGIVVGDYEFKDVVNPSYAHRKSVIWLNQGPILPNKLPNPTLAGFMTTCSRLVKRKQEMVTVLLGKNTMSAIKAHSCFILTQYSDSKYDDVEGEQYQYDNQKPNSRKLLEGSKFIIQSKINNENCFVGYGKIESITESSDTNEKGKSITKFVAKFSEYNKFEPPKLRTTELYENMKSQKAYGSQPPSILPITRQLYKKITGQDLGEDKEEIIGMKTDYSRTVNILKRKKNIILYGPPGTGKTYTAKKIAELIIKETSSEKNNLKQEFLSDDGFNSHILNMFKNISESQKYQFSKIKNNLIQIQNVNRTIRIACYFSKSEKENPNDVYVGISKKTIEFLNDVPKEDRFLLIINNYVRNFVILPYSIEQKYARFVGGENWDKTGVSEHAFHISINKESSELPTNEKIGGVSVLDCTQFLGKMSVLFPNLKLENNAEPDLENNITVTFHQSYGYEEFLEGIKPTPTKDGISYPIVPGIFKEFCNKARNNSNQNFVMIIDEINRGNISKIFGELITIIENDKRGQSVKLAYSKEDFNVPSNIHIIGTMNTADQSLTHMDAALKRRFSLVEIMPTPSLLKPTKSGIPLGSLLEKLNDRIIINGSRDNQIGHSYFMDDGKSIDSTEDLQFVFATDIIPLLRDYFYDDENSLKEILGEQFIDWNNPHRDMKDDWQEDPQVFLNTLKDAFGIKID